MAHRCTKHSFEQATAACRTCQEPFCAECLVYTYGPDKPPYCVPCALVAAGVRRHSPSERKIHKKSKGNGVVVAAPVDLTDDDEAALLGATPAAGRSRIGVLAIGAGAVITAVPLVARFTA